MAEIDTSSYPKPLPAANPLDIAGKLGVLQQQKLNIDQAKLDQANQGLTYMVRAMGALGPDATKEQYIQAAGNAVKMGLVPENQLRVFEERAQAAKSPKDFYNEFMTTAVEHQQQINYHLGQRVDVGNGQTVTPAVTSVKPGFGVRPISLPIQQQAPPTTPTVNENNQPQFLGAQPTQIPEDAVPANTGIPGQFRQPLPAARPAMPPPAVSGPTGPTVERTPNSIVDNRFPKPRGPAAGPSPLFPEGKEAYTKAQLAAGGRATAIKPAIQALKLMPGIATGPGTEQFNTAVAGLKAWGLIDTKDNDPTVIRQELNKKLAQYVGNSPIGQRSDAQQALAEAGSPNPKVQLTQALQNLTRDAVALDRVNILAPRAFKGQDYQNFIKHQGVFPSTIDEKALTLDLLPEAERNSLVKKMANQYKNGNAGEKKSAEKFLTTLKLAKEHNIYEGME